MEERVDWIMNNVPVSSLSIITKHYIEKWMSEDLEDTKNWINTLPPSEQKEYLQGVYGNQ